MVFLVPIAAFLGFIVFCALMTTGEPLNPIRPLMSYEQARDHARRLAKMIRCKTVSHKDSYDDAAFYDLREVMKREFPLIHQHCRKMTFGDDCWVYVLAGLNDDRNIMLMSHHDVVAAEGEWKHPPFSGEIADAKLWGRGTVDTKTPLYGIFAALEKKLSEGYFPECNIWIGSSCNEEVAGNGIPLAVEYFREQGITFELVLDEGGAVIDPPLPGMICPKCAMVAVHEKGRHKRILKASDAPGHASLTAGAKATATERMAAFITECRTNTPFIRRMNPQVEAMFKALTPYMTFPMKMIFANLWCFRSLLIKLLPKISPAAGGLLGTTCTFNDLQTQQGKECTAGILLRSVNDEDLQQDLKALEALAGKYGIEVLPDGEDEYHAPADHTLPQFKLVSKCIHSVFPDVPVIPFILPAGTDGRWLTEICPCVLRFAPIRLSAQQLASVHSADENIDVTAIGACVVFYTKLLEQYAAVWEEVNERAEDEPKKPETTEEEPKAEETAEETEAGEPEENTRAEGSAEETQPEASEEGPAEATEPEAEPEEEAGQEQTDEATDDNRETAEEKENNEHEQSEE